MSVVAGDAVWRIGGDTGDLEKALKQATGKVAAASRYIGAAFTVAGAAMTAAVAKIGAASLGAAGEVGKASRRMTAALGLPAEEAERFRQIIRDVYSKNLGDSLEDVGQAVQAVALNLRRLGVTSNADIQKATSSALMLRDAFGVDVSESVNAVSGLMQNFKMTSEQAFDFITLGMQKGLDASGDFLDSIGEYSTQFAEGGATAADFFNAMEKGMQSGMLGTDKAADAFKEFRVRILDGSKTTADALAMIGLDVGKITDGLNNKTITVAQAWNLVIGRLKQTGDSALQMQAGVGLIGTQFEDLGAKTVLAMNMSGASMTQMAGATNQLSMQYAGLGNDIEGVKRRMELAAESIGNALGPSLAMAFDRIAPLVEATIAWIEANPDLAATLLMVAGAVGAVLTVVGPMLMLLPGLAMAWGTITTIFSAVAAGAAALATALSLPVAAVVAAVAAIVAAGYLLWDNWEIVKGGLIAVWDGIKAAFFSIWGPIIDTIQWLGNVGLGMLAKVGGFFGMGGGSMFGPPGMATGGTVQRAGWAMVGERGPELVSLPQGATVYDAEQTKAAGGGGGNSITINFGRDSVRSDNDIREIERGLTRILGSGLQAAGVRML